MGEVTVIQIKDTLIQLFNETELRELCIELGEDYESFGGNGKAGKALEIASWSQRHGRIHDLVALIKRERPHAFPNSPIPAASSNPAATANEPQQAQSGGNVYHIHGNVIGGNLGDGDINAQNIAGGDVNVDNRSYSAGGDMYVAEGDININAPATKPEFNTQLAELQQLVQELVAAGAIADEGDAEDTLSGMNSAAQEAEKEQPNCKRLKRKLKTVMDILETTKDTAKVAGKTAVSLAKAAALSGVLFETVTKLF